MHIDHFLVFILPVFILSINLILPLPGDSSIGVEKGLR